MFGINVTEVIGSLTRGLVDSVKEVAEIVENIPEDFERGYTAKDQDEHEDVNNAQS